MIRNKNLNNNILTYYISIVIVFAIDHNLGLMGLIPYIENFKKRLGFENYLASNTEVFFIFIILNLITFFFIIKLKINGLKILTIFVFSIIIVNIFDYRKNISSFPRVDLTQNIKENINYKNKKLVIIFDEMSGINSLESNHISSLNFIKNINNLFKNYNFTYYPNAHSASEASDISIPTLLNFITDKNQISNFKKLRALNKNPLVRKSKNYFIENELVKNNFFDKEENLNIVVHQSIYLDFCKHHKVIKCHQFNPFDRKNLYIEGFNDNFISRSLSAYTNSLSIFGKLLLRVFRQLKIADSYLDPIGEKASFPFLLNKVLNGLDSENANLFFAHYLVPHSPYLWDENCKFNGSRESNGKFFQFHLKDMEQRVIQHNIERNCVVYYMDIFFKELSKKNYWDDLEVFLISDHGGRLLSENENFKSAIFAIKNKSIAPGLVSEKITTNNVFKKLNN